MKGPHVREVLLAALMAVAYAIVAAGVGLMHRPAGVIVAGLMLGVWAWQTFSEDG